MPRPTLPALAACLCLPASALVLPAVASAAPLVGFDLRITPYRGGGSNAGNFGFPYADLTNTSDSADIVDYQLTIGDESYFWDLSRVNASSQVPSASATNVAPGEVIDNVGGDVIHYTFAPGVFTPGTTFSHRSDIDRQSEVGAAEVYTENQPDFRNVLFDLGGSDTADNALVTVTYSDGQTLSTRVPEFPAATSNDYYSFSFSGSQVPEPSALCVIGLAAAGALGRRRRT